MLHDFNYLGICVQIAYNSHLSGLRGHDNLQTASMAGCRSNLALAAALAAAKAAA